MKNYLLKCWDRSLPHDIWEDLTIFGRITLWIPLVILCYMLVLPILIVGLPMVYVFTVWDRVNAKSPPIFFKDHKD